MGIAGAKGNIDVMGQDMVRESEWRFGEIHQALSFRGRLV
jgi:hypothetical protein